LNRPNNESFAGDLGQPETGLLARRFAIWSAAVLAVIVATTSFEGVARPQQGEFAIAVGSAQAAAVFALLALTMNPQDSRSLNLSALGAWVWLVAGWTWSAVEMSCLGGLAGLLFATQVGSGLLLAWARHWQALLSAAAGAAFLVSIVAEGAWHARALSELGLVLLGGVVGCAVISAARTKSGSTLFDRYQQTLMEKLIHEIRSPAGAISMRVELLREQVSDAQTRNALEAIGAAAFRILSIADNLCDVFQIEMGEVRGQPRPVDVNSVVENTAAELAAPAHAKGVEVEMVLDRSLPPVAVDPRHLKRAIANLLDNAIKFSPKGGRVKVSTALSPPWVAIAFKDSGPGLEPAQRDGLVGRPKRPDHRSGSGLGLFVARRMVELCGGKILVESEPRHGTTFTVIIPQELKRSTSARNSDPAD
jgi:signal transduction histidine kinase